MSGLLEQIDYHLMALTFMIREMFAPPEKLLPETGIAAGFRVLDYGCGIGSCSMAAARLVGPGGRVYAVDISPLALRYVERAIKKSGLNNIEIIQTGCALDLPDDSMDLVLLYDVYHDLGEAPLVMKELHRVLKKEGTLSFSDHHMKEKDIIRQLTASGLFQLTHKGEKTCAFTKG